MVDITILEGARGTGKSTLAFKMRQRISETTLINPTGFHLDGDKGMEKVADYYDVWFSFLTDISKHKSSILFDRFYFSEKVFSSLYKKYNFTLDYEYYNFKLNELSKQGVRINIFFLTINDEEELKTRLVRDKVPFGKAEESVKETLLQQKEYEKLFDKLRNESILNIHYIDTSGKTTDEVYEEILQLKTAN